MDQIQFEKGRVIRFLAWTFGLAYLIQLGVALLAERGYAVVAQLVMAGMMFVPTLGVLLSGGRLKTIGWNPRIKQNWKLFLVAWFSPAVLTFLGAALYFLVFPGHFDLTGAYLSEAAGQDVLAQLEAQGLSYPMYLLIQVIACVTYAPAINALAGLGEEIGWRGFLYPQLKARFGSVWGRVLGGLIWSAWHWPLIWLIGYEYGTDYFGFPVVGMLVFCVFCFAGGVLCDWLYTRGRSIWLPAVFHGSINAAATLPLVVSSSGIGTARLLGPVPNGLLAVLPTLLLAILLLRRDAAPVSPVDGL